MKDGKTYAVMWLVWFSTIFFCSRLANTLQEHGFSEWLAFIISACIMAVGALTLARCYARHCSHIRRGES